MRVRARVYICRIQRLTRVFCANSEDGTHSISQVSVRTARNANSEEDPYSSAHLRVQVVEPPVAAAAGCGTPEPGNATATVQMGSMQVCFGTVVGSPYESAGMASPAVGSGAVQQGDVRDLEGGKEGKRHTLAEVEEQMGRLRQLMDSQARADSEECAILGEQLMSASRLIQTLKAKLELLAKENSSLREVQAVQKHEVSRLEEQVSQLQAQRDTAGTSEDVPQLQAQVAQLQAQVSTAGTSIKCENCSKRLKGATDQMAKLMAMHAKEKAAWLSTEKELNAQLKNAQLNDAQLCKKLETSRSLLGIIHMEVIAALPLFSMNVLGRTPIIGSARLTRGP